MDTVCGKTLSIGFQPVRIASAPENQADIIPVGEQLQGRSGIRQIVVGLLILIAGTQNRVVNVHDHIDLLPVLLPLAAECGFKSFGYIHTILFIRSVG